MATGDGRTSADAVTRHLGIDQAHVANIRQTLGFAFLYNALGVPLAAGVLHPKFGLLLSPLLAALATNHFSVSVVANALRLRAAPLGGNQHDHRRRFLSADR